MVKHKFVWTEEGWKVLCPETEGNFYTIVWRKGKVKDKHCMCCNQIIR